MPHPIAIAFIHGIGRTKPGYSAPMQRALTRLFTRRIAGACAVPESMLVFEEINWSPALQRREERLWRRLSLTAGMRYRRLRRFMVDFAADAIAYQPAPSDRSAYDAVHETVAEGLARLAERAGARAPLCIVSHSLGTVIASNYVYDLAKRRKSFMGSTVRAAIGTTPLERGETLSLFYTMGSPIALWGIRYPRFGDPIRFPPRNLAGHHPGIEAEWLNFYDPDDVIAYPLKSLCARYGAAVTADRRVDVGSILTRWTPLSHVAYWGDGTIADQITAGIERVWRQSSALAMVSRRKPGARPRRVRRA